MLKPPGERRRWHSQSLCYASRKGLSCLTWMIVVILDMMNLSVSVPHFMSFRGATCSSRWSNVSHSTTHCGLSATINLNRGSIPKAMKIPDAVSRRYFLRKRAGVLNAGNTRRRRSANLVKPATHVCNVVSQVPVMPVMDDCHAAY